MALTYVIHVQAYELHLYICLYFDRTKGKYGEGEKAEKFKYTLALVFVQCIINALAAKIGMLFICLFHNIVYSMVKKKNTYTNISSPVCHFISSSYLLLEISVIQEYLY